MGPSFYVNLGVYFRSLGDRDNPCEYDCHVRTRLTTSSVPAPERLNELLDFERTVPESARFQELEALVVEYGVQWLATVSTIEGAREYCGPQFHKSVLVARKAQAFLGVAHGA